MVKTKLNEIILKEPGLNDVRSGLCSREKLINRCGHVCLYVAIPKITYCCKILKGGMK